MVYAKLKSGLFSRTVPPICYENKLESIHCCLSCLPIPSDR